MILRLLIAALAAIFFFIPALAQQPDNATILKAIQGLSGRIDGLQKDVDQLKGGRGAPSAKTVQTPSNQPSSTPAPTVAAVKPRGKAIPGWLINVIPGDSDTRDAVATFNGPLSDYNFSLHSKATDARNEFIYSGSAFFHPEQAGRYVFTLNVYPVQGCCQYGNFVFDCGGNVKIADNVVVSGETKLSQIGGVQYPESHFIYRDQSFSGGADLDSVDYKITFQVNCFVDERRKGQNVSTFFKAYQANKFSILVKGPDDGAARPFETTELFHVGKAKKPRKKTDDN